MSFLSMPVNEEIEGLALGKFDGMHLAHQELFKRLLPLGERAGVLCIDKPSASLSKHAGQNHMEQKSTGRELDSENSQNLALTPNKQLYSPFRVISVDFREIMAWSGEEFLAHLKQKFPNLSRLVVGYDFYFGKNRAFSASDLPRLFGGEVCIVPEVKIGGLSVHSSLIAELIRHGDMRVANAMLGRFYRIEGEVIRGQGLGAKQLYATINLSTQGFILPQEGVYAALSEVDSVTYKSVCFVGHRLSTDRQFSIESHILGREIALESNFAAVSFVQKIRDNQSFEHLEELKARIAQDIAQAQDILADVD